MYAVNNISGKLMQFVLLVEKDHDRWREKCGEIQYLNLDLMEV